MSVKSFKNGSQWPAVYSSTPEETDQDSSNPLTLGPKCHVSELYGNKQNKMPRYRREYRTMRL